MKRIQKLIAFFCSLLMLLSMCGCRDSAVVEEMIYDYLRAEETDMDKITYDDKEGYEEDDLLNDLTKDEDSRRENDEEEVDPVLDSQETPTTEEAAGNPNYETNADESKEAATVSPNTIQGGAAKGGDSSQGTPSQETTKEPETTENTEEPVPTSNGNESSEEGDNPSPNEGENKNEQGNGEDPGSTESTRTVVDAYGNEVTIPENVESVSAVGSAAIAVLMLGGVSCLAATDAELTSNALATTVFSGLSSVPALWSGSSSTLSDSGLQQLIDIHPDVCLETSGSATLTEAQVNTLAENGISYVVLPAPTSSANLKLIAELVGTVLGDHSADGGYDSVGIASTYASWVDSALSSAAGGGSAYTLYVDEWDSDATYTIEQASCSGYGVAVLSNGQMDACICVSNFLNSASITNVTSISSFSQTEKIYFTPIDVNYSTVRVVGTKANRLTPVKILANGGNLGSENFRVVIAGSQSVKAGIESNYLWQNFGLVTSSNGNFTSYGFLDDLGEIVRSTIAGDYTVVVNPNGVGDWAQGSVESVLEAVWAAYAVKGTYSESDVRNKVSEFYSTFYHYELSDAQLDQILAGEY